MQPLISIIVPCYNVENYIDRCASSVFGQTIGLENLQVIFVDDCSTDGTLDKLLSVESHCPDSVCVVQNGEKLHSGGARSVGLTYATAPYIAFLDADDWIDPDMYQKMYEKITSLHCDFVMCGHSRDITADTSSTKSIPTASPPFAETLLEIHSPELRKRLIVENLFGCFVWDKLYDRNYWLQNNLSFPWHTAYEDIPFGCRLHLTVKRAFIMKEPFYHYMVNPSSLVLKQNEPYHFDILETNELKWQILSSHPDFGICGQELKFDYLMTGFFGCLKVLFLRFTDVPYDKYELLRRRVLSHVPDYAQNPYLACRVPKVYKLLLPLLTYQVSPDELKQAAQAFRQIMGIDRF